MRVVIFCIILTCSFVVPTVPYSIAEQSNNSNSENLMDWSKTLGSDNYDEYFITSTDSHEGTYVLGYRHKTSGKNHGEWLVWRISDTGDIIWNNTMSRESNADLHSFYTVDDGIVLITYTYSGLALGADKSRYIIFNEEGEKVTDKHYSETKEGTVVYGMESERYLFPIYDLIGGRSFLGVNSKDNMAVRFNENLEVKGRLNDFDPETIVTLDDFIIAVSKHSSGNNENITVRKISTGDVETTNNITFSDHLYTQQVGDMIIISGEKLSANGTKYVFIDSWGEEFYTVSLSSNKNVYSVKDLNHGFIFVETCRIGKSCEPNRKILRFDSSGEFIWSNDIVIKSNISETSNSIYYASNGKSLYIDAPINKTNTGAYNYKTIYINSDGKIKRKSKIVRADLDVLNVHHTSIDTPIPISRRGRHHSKTWHSDIRLLSNGAMLIKKNRDENKQATISKVDQHGKTVWEYRNELRNPRPSTNYKYVDMLKTEDGQYILLRTRSKSFQLEVINNSGVRVKNNSYNNINIIKKNSDQIFIGQKNAEDADIWVGKIKLSGYEKGRLITNSSDSDSGKINRTSKTPDNESTSSIIDSTIGVIYDSLSLIFKLAAFLAALSTMAALVLQLGKSNYTIQDIPSLLVDSLTNSNSQEGGESDSDDHTQSDSQEDDLN